MSRFATKTIPFSNKSITVRPECNDEFVFDEVFVHDGYRALYDFKPGDTKVNLIDIGANIGSFSMLLAPYVAQVMAFEPEADNYEILSKNLTEFGLYNPVDEPMAVSNSTDPVWVSDKLGGLVSVSPVELDDCKVQVPATTLDQIVNSGVWVHPARGFTLKIDTEGYEPEILLSASPETLRHINVIYGEYHGDGPEWGEMMRYLSGFFNLEIIGHKWPDHVSGGTFRGYSKFERVVG